MARAMTMTVMPREMLIRSSMAASCGEGGASGFLVLEYYGERKTLAPMAGWLHYSPKPCCWQRGEGNSLWSRPGGRTRMLAPYRRLTISTKLLISSLAFALPMAVLAWFMDISFVYDLDIARREMAGNQYQRSLFPLLKHVPQYRLLRLQGVGENDPEVLEHAGYVNQALDGAVHIDPDTEAELKLTDASLSAMGFGHAAPSNLMELWEEVQADPEDHAAFQELMQGSRDLFHYVAEKSMLVVDPVLDSNYLAQVTVRDLPLYNELMLSLLEFQRQDLSSLSEMQGVKLHDFVLLLRDSAANHIAYDAEMAVSEDPLFYGLSPTLHERFVHALTEFTARNEDLARFMELAADQGAVQDSEVFEEKWRAAYVSGCDLFEVGSQELDELLSLRMASYSSWRRWGFILSSVALVLAGLLVASVARDVHRPVHSLIAYSRRVARGDYQAEPETPPGKDLADLSGNIRSMVGELKHRLAFSQGIQESIAAPFLVSDTRDKITFVNQAMLRLLEYDLNPEEHQGQDIFDFFSQNQAMRQLADDCLNKRICVENQELGITGHQGSERVVSVYISPLYNLEDELIGSSTFIFDLSDLKASQAEILEKQDEIQRLAAIPMENPSPVLTASEGGDIAYTNLATELTLTRLNVHMEEFLPPVHHEVVAACLENQTGRSQVEHKVEDRIYAWTYNPLYTHNVVHIHVQDVTEQKRMQEQLLHDAFHDALTGLPNRALFMDRLDQALARAKEIPAAGFAVLFLDMDRFKFINDSLGHMAGDELLVALSRRLERVLGTQDTLARLGGDEYTVLLSSVSNESEALLVAERLQEVLNDPFDIHGRELFTTASIGIVFDTGEYDGAEELLRDADTAMYRAKARGKARCEVFDADMHQSARQRLEMEMDLTRAVDKGEFRVFYQPILNLVTGRIAGFEALVRWFHPHNGMVSPGAFIPLAEETGLIVPMGKYVLGEALRTGAAWLDHDPGLMMSVNLSVRQFTSETLVQDVDAAIAESGFPARLLKLEVTESGIMDNAEASLALLATLRDRGIKLSIDDFGTGYSSLNYLHRFPFDFLKVDQSFVRLIEENRAGDTSGENNDAGIIKTIVSLAHDLGKQVIAEGIETVHQQRRLTDLGCEFGQGFLFAKPMPGQEAGDLLRTDPSW
ncbi:MAG: EAL domain-containing protein [Desulfovibrio sp.]|nr:MAG: EAL domain-containing protein [Desulfovibrio sp.]